MPDAGGGRCCEADLGGPGEGGSAAGGEAINYALADHHQTIAAAHDTLLRLKRNSNALIHNNK